MTRQINPAGLELIKKFEGCELTAYKDVAGNVTIGYGHFDPDLPVGTVITQSQADAYLLDDVAIAEDAVSSMVTVELTDNQFSALVDFTYNLGAGSLCNSTLLKIINAGDYDSVPVQMLLWIHADGKEQPGLLRRREAEVALWNTP